MIPTTTTTGADVVSGVVSSSVSSSTNVNTTNLSGMTATNFGVPAQTIVAGSPTAVSETPLKSPAESIADAIAGGQAANPQPTVADISATNLLIQQTIVNLPVSKIQDGKVVPVINPNSVFYTVKFGIQSTSPLARGYVTGSIIDLLNGNIDHVCDFKFIFPDFNTLLGQLGLVNPVEAIRDAIKNAKLKATNTLRKLIQEAVTAIRTALNATIAVLGLDASGVFSFNISALKAIAAEVNSVVKKVASAVETVLEYVFLAQQVIQLINWIKTLPAKLQQLLQNCLNQFGASIKQIANDIKSIPDQISSLTNAQLTDIANQFTQAGQLALDAANINTTNNTMPDAVVQAFSQPDTIATALAEDYTAKQTILADYKNSQMDAKLLAKKP